MSNEKLPLEKLLDNLQIQLDELESLQSVFCNPGEIRVDPETFFEITEYVKRNAAVSTVHLDYVINLNLDKFKFEICVNLPYEYPDVTPEIFVRSNVSNRTQHVEINKEINKFIAEQEKGVPCVFLAISWLQDNYEKYVVIKEEVSTSSNTKNESLVRYWIYAHHIYSKTKRREIVDQAHNYKLNGFCMAGKPGIICVEGPISDCDAWWQIIKSMSWKKIFCKCTEENNNEENFCKFSTFQEISFPTTSSARNHSNMGEFSIFLENYGLSYMFKDLFGIEAKPNSKV